MSVFKKQHTKPMPADAKRILRDGVAYACWTDRYGRKQSARITAGRNGDERIVRESKTYWIRYKDASGVVHEQNTACRSKDTAEAVLAAQLRRVELVKAGVITAEEDTAAENAAVAISEHIAAYTNQLSLVASSRHVRNVVRQLNRLTSDCGWNLLRDIQGEDITKWLIARRADGMGPRTRNTYRSAVHGFCKWCLSKGRMMKNPVTTVPRAKEREDLRHQRRSLKEEEIGRLLTAARLRPVAEYGRETIKLKVTKGEGKRSNWKRQALEFANLEAAYIRGYHALSGKTGYRQQLIDLGIERELIYRTLLLTGLRKGELGSITVAQVELESDTPHMVLNAADEKNGRGSIIPIRADLAGDLREYLKKQEEALDPSSPLFRVPRDLYRILDRDLAVAGIPKRDSRDRVMDVHALRHTFGSMLSRAGVPLRTAQSALRHSTPVLTANLYTDPAVLDVGGAIDSLPAFTRSAPGSSTEDAGVLEADGTDG